MFNVSNLLKIRISHITDEVRVFHPLLETIFSKMNTLLKVEYTHGPDEKGADFILTKISEELGDTEYIGVIVKVGKINQAIRSVTEQIEECTLRRLSPNAKKQIYLSEIWVVINGTITTNAKEKIYEKYKTQKIKFVDITILTKWAVIYVPDYGIDVAIQDNNLIAKQRELSIEREQKFNLLPNGNDGKHLTPEIVMLDDNFNKKEVVNNINERITKSNFISIESQMGGGKTKLLNNIVQYFSDIEVYKDKRICPIYLTCKEIISYKKTLQEIVDEKIILFNLQKDKRRRYLFLIDVYLTTDWSL